MMTEVNVGDRVQIDSCAVRMSFPKDRTGQVSPAGVRLTRVFEYIVDATKFMPYVTEVRDDDIEIASSYFDAGMQTLRIPKGAVQAVAEARDCRADAEALRTACASPAAY
jgi:hypothetical protein